MQASPIEVQKSLKNIDYPVHKKDLIQHAKKHGASGDEIQKKAEQALTHLPGHFLICKRRSDRLL